MRIAKASGAGFTLIELLVGCVLLVVLLIILTGIVNQTSFTLRFTTAKVQEFRVSREAFESVTRRLSQATLNTYWDYQYNTATPPVPTQYIRQSNLRFLSGSATTITGSATASGHGIFFQAPMGFVSDRVSFDGLGNLLNTWGYYAEYNTDRSLRPAFLNQVNPPLPDRYRYRLMELMEPADEFSLYAKTSGAGNTSYNGLDWIRVPLGYTPPATRVLSENVVALVFLPKLSVEDAANASIPPLASSYIYDSTVTTTANPLTNPKNQLPPIVQVTLVAIDETSGARLAGLTLPPNGPTPVDLGTTGATPSLFSTTLPNSYLQYDADLQTLQNTLTTLHLTYRVFTTNVSIRAAKWSRN